MRPGALRQVIVATLVCGLLATAGAIRAQPSADTTPTATPNVTPNVTAAVTVPTVEELARQLEELRAQYEARIDQLERRVEELMAASARPPATATEPPAPPTDELAALRAAAAAAAGESAATASAERSADAAIPPVIGEAIVGHERNLSRLNPEISFTGDVLGLGGNGNADFDAREFELDFQAALDPFSTTKWTIAFAPEEEVVEVEEGYVRYDGLLPGLGLRAGRMRQTFGALNRWHLHALPAVDYPLALQAYFGDEGLAQTGLSAEWLLPRPWATANELTVQVTDGSAEPFGGESFHRLAALAHLKNYWDLSPATYLEWGLSGIAGSPASGRDSRVWGSDLTLHWQPPSRARYRELTWRSELLLSQRDDELGVRREAWGGYSYLEALLRQNLYAGVRYDRVEDPLLAERLTWGVEPYLTWWQSEFVRLRAAWQYRRDDLLAEGHGRFVLQATWAAGPHKHETY